MDYDPRAREQRKIIRKTGDPTWGFIWRFLACCFVIDAGVWGYFTFIEKVPVFVGLQRIYDEIHKNGEAERIVKRVVRHEVIQKETKMPIVETAKNQHENQEAVGTKYKGAIYSWTNKEGKRAFSNAGFPKNETYTDGKIELNQ